jgi:hypothetical protein
VSGPHGPTGPGDRQLLSAGKYEILSAGSQTSFHLFAVVSSLGALSSHAKTVTASFLGSNHK